MPCYNKQHIINRSQHFVPEIDTVINEVDCGKCESCLKKKRDDMYVRSRFEFASCLNQDPFTGKQYGAPGFALFITLTYAEGHVPVRLVADHDLDGHVSTFPVYGFSYAHVRKYLDTLNQHLRDKYNAQHDVRYFIGQEYGHSDPYYDDHGLIRVGTARPHMHGNLFFPAELTPYKAEIAQYCIDLWQSQGHGIASYPKVNDPLSGEINHFEGLKYVAKYTNKSTEYFENPNLLAYLYREDLKGLDYRATLPRKPRFSGDFSQQDFDVEVARRISLIRDLLPASPWKSLHYGESMVDWLRSLSVEDRYKAKYDGVSWHDDVQNKIYSTPRYYNVPLFIMRKVIYDYDRADVVNPETGNHVHPICAKRYNDMARTDAEFAYYRQLEASSKALDQRASDFRIRQIYNDDKIKALYKHNVHYNSVEELLSFLKSVEARYSRPYLLSYKKIRFVSWNPMQKELIHSLDEDDFIDFVAGFEMAKLKLTKKIPISSYCPWLPKGRPSIRRDRHTKRPTEYCYDDFAMAVNLDIEQYFHTLDILSIDESKVRYAEWKRNQEILQRYQQATTIRYRSFKTG